MNQPGLSQGIRVLVASFGTLDQTQYSNFHTQVKGAIEWVERQFNALEPEIQKSMELRSYPELIAMSTPALRVPIVDDVSKARTRQT
jgi:hypothetical protein